jgi:hypothetical protein
MSKEPTKNKQIDLLIEEMQALKSKVEKLESLMLKQDNKLTLGGKIVTIQDERTIIKATKVEEDV